VAHRFSIGQAVGLTSTAFRPMSAGEYEIRQLVPASDSDPGDPRYRVKNIGESYERVVRESEITRSRRPDASMFRKLGVPGK